MTENFSNLAKEIDIQVQGAQSPKQDETKKTHMKTLHNKNAKVKDNLKSSKRKAVGYLQLSCHMTASRFLNRNLSGHKELAQNVQGDERQRLTTKIESPRKEN